MKVCIRFGWLIIRVHLQSLVSILMKLKKAGNFLIDQLSDCQPQKKGSAAWS